MTSPPERSERDRAIGLIILAFAFFAMLDACAKYLSGWHSIFQIVWARYVGHFLFAMLIYALLGGAGTWRSRRPALQIVRSGLLLAATALNFIALQYLQLAETSAISFTIPIWVALLSAPLLGERIDFSGWAAIVVGFIGVLIIVRPGSGFFHWAILLSLSVAIIVAFYQIATRKLAGVDSSHTTQLYTALVGTIVVSPIVPFYWVTPEGSQLWAMIGIGVLGGAGHYLLIISHRWAPAPVLAPFWYTQIIWMILIGYLVFSDLPDFWTLVGAAIVVASGWYLIKH